MSTSPKLRLAATCIPIRELDRTIQVLMVRRNPELSFGGLWTFPGGTLEEADGPLPSVVDEATQNWSDPSLVMTAAAGAVRETHEETSLDCAMASLAWFSHWIPPMKGPPKRFATWFFLAPEPTGTIEVDMSENSDARWIAPRAALEENTVGGFPLTVPTWVTLDDLAVWPSMHRLLDRTVTDGPSLHHTRGLCSETGRVLCWAGDAGYETGDAHAPGARNRVVADESGSVLERIRHG